VGLINQTPTNQSKPYKINQALQNKQGGLDKSSLYKSIKPLQINETSFKLIKRMQINQVPAFLIRPKDS